MIFLVNTPEPQQNHAKKKTREIRGLSSCVDLNGGGEGCIFTTTTKRITLYELYGSGKRGRFRELPD